MHAELLWELSTTFEYQVILFSEHPHLVDCLLNVYTLKRPANLFALVDGLVNKDLICFILVLSSTEFSTCLQINNTTQMLAKFSAPWLKGRFLFLSWNNWNLSKWCEQRRKVRWSVRRLNVLQKGINGNETKVPWHEGSEWSTITSRTIWVPNQVLPSFSAVETF